MADQQRGMVEKVVDTVVSTGWRILAGTLDGILALVGRTDPEDRREPRLETSSGEEGGPPEDSEPPPDTTTDPLPEQEAYQQAEKFRKSGDVEISGLKDLPGIGKSRADTLREAGFLSPKDIGAASVADLTQVAGIGQTTAEKLKKAVSGGEESSPVDSTF